MQRIDLRPFELLSRQRQHVDRPQRCRIPSALRRLKVVVLSPLLV